MEDHRSLLSGQLAEERRPFFLDIDEFHHVATPSMASLFSGMRKYRLGLTVAHQDLYQLHSSAPEVERSLLANAYSRVVFRVGDDDARQLVRELSAERWGGGEESSDSEQPSRPRAETASGDEPPPAFPPATPQARVTAAAPKEGRESPEPAAAAPRRAARLNKQTLDYLQHVASEPFLSIRERNAELRLSAWRGQRSKKELLAKGLVREVAVNPGGRGERFKLLELTAEGRNLLTGYGIEIPTGFGRGGLLHQWWADRIAAWLESQGFTTKVEDESRGARVDLAFTALGRRIAVEIETNDGHVLENLRKDLDAGFDHVISLLDEEISKKAIEKQLIAEWGSVPAEIHIDSLPLHEAALTPLLFPHPPPLRPPNQNEEASRLRRRRRQQTINPLMAPGYRAAGHDALPGVLTTPEAAEYLGLSPATLETLRTRGGGPVFAKLGARVVYEKDDLDRWLNERKRTSTSDPGSQL